MKKHRKVTALAMSSAMVLAALAGCAGGKDKDETTTAAQVDTTAEQTAAASTEAPTAAPTEAPTEEPTSEPDTTRAPGPDFKGRDVKIVSRRNSIVDNSWRGGLLVRDGAQAKTAYQEDLADQIREYEKTYNFSVHLDTLDVKAEEYYVMLTSTITAGEPIGNIAEIEPEWFAALLNSKMLAPLDDLPYLNFKEEKWNQGVLEMTSFNGHIYGMSVDREFGYVVFFSKKLLQEAGLGAEDLYDLQKNDTWTWSEFEKVLKACTRDTDDDGTTDTWGLAELSSAYYTAAIHASGADFVTKDENGHFVNAMDSEEFLSTLTWADGMRQYSKPQSEDAVASDPVAAFNQGEAALLVAPEKIKSELTTDDWGIVMFPCPDGKELIATDMASAYIIPSSFSKDDANTIALFFDLITERVPGYCDTEDIWRETYYEFVKDGRSVDETLQRMRYGKNVKPCAELYVQNRYRYDADIVKGFLQPLAEGKITPAEGIEANMEKWREIIEDQNTALDVLRAN